jgi:RNA recognition motif-containing protein
MTDTIKFKIDKKSKFGYRLVVKNLPHYKRGWIYLYNPENKIIIDTPVQTYFVFRNKEFVRETYDDLSKKKLTPITKSDIYKLFSNYGF